MKRFFVYAAIVSVLTACGGKDEEVKVEETPPLVALSKSKNSIEFNQSFSKMMDDYFHLKDNFITESLPMIDVYADRLMKSTDSLKLSELKDDAGLIETAKASVTSMIAEMKGIKGEKELTGKRKSFNMLTSNLYDLLRTVRYDREIIYHQHCPMAFEEGDANAYWLSRTSDIKNPYIPKKSGMLTCGDIPDSLDYRPK
jgi:hypothetical protein